MIIKRNAGGAWEVFRGDSSANGSATGAASGPGVQWMHIVATPMAAELKAARLQSEKALAIVRDARAELLAKLPSTAAAVASLKKRKTSGGRTSLRCCKRLSDR